MYRGGLLGATGSHQSNGSGPPRPDARLLRAQLSRSPANQSEPTLSKTASAQRDAPPPPHPLAWAARAPHTIESSRPRRRRDGTALGPCADWRKEEGQGGDVVILAPAVHASQRCLCGGASDVLGDLRSGGRASAADRPPGAICCDAGAWVIEAAKRCSPWRCCDMSRYVTDGTASYKDGLPKHYKFTRPSNKR